MSWPGSASRPSSWEWNFETLPGEWSDRLSRWVIDQDAALELINNGLNPCTADRTLDDLHLVG